MVLFDDYNRALGEYEAIKREVDSLSADLASISARYTGLQEVQSAFQAAAEIVQSGVKEQIISVVNLALQVVFPEPYEMDIRFGISNNRQEAKIIFTRDGLEIEPMTNGGGGVIDVASFALRISMLMLSGMKNNTVILDEPFRFVSEKYRKHVIDMLITISRKMGIQFIVITHMNELTSAADKVFIVNKTGKISKVET